ncbi:MAG: toll/interleukin-1 receptor domain-containing protein, partial [Chloroflexota bacterium]
MDSENKRVFISYGHRDGLEFVRRLSFSLEMYMDVFWDRKLRDGAFDTQLIDEIEKCDYLLIVMTPSALRKEGWCRIEITEAIERDKPIIPIKLHDACGFTEYENILEHNQYADFRVSFDAGFQQLTQIILGYPYLSWEFFVKLKDHDLLEQLQMRRIPHVIENEIVEWVLVEKAWSLVQFASCKKDYKFYATTPRTLFGILEGCKTVLNQATQNNDSSLLTLVLDIEKITQNFVRDKTPFSPNVSGT